MDPQVKLLLHFDGQNGSQIVTDSSDSSHIIVVTGNTKIATDQYKVGNSSLYFDGNGDYLSIADSEDFNFGADDFTIDFWVRFEVLPGSGYYNGLFSQRYSYNNDHGYTCSVYNNSGTYQIHNSFTYNGSTEQVFAVDYPFTTNEWYHIEIARENVYLGNFVNGNLIETTYIGTNSIHNSSDDLIIGGYKMFGGIQASIGLHGWLDEFRISTGACQHSLRSFAPSTTNFVPDSDTKLLLHMDGENGSTTFIDSSDTSHAISSNGVYQNTGMNGLVQEYLFEDNADDTSGNGYNGSVYNVTYNASGKVNKSAVFNGTNAYISIPRIISDDFSICFWFKSTQGISTSNDWWNGAGLVDAEVIGYTVDFGCSLNANGKVLIGGPSRYTGASASSGFNNGEWHQVVFIHDRINAKLYLYVDKNLEATVNSTTDFLTAPSAIHIGKILAGGKYFSGEIDQVRIYNKVVSSSEIEALYNDAGESTDNFRFSAPSSIMPPTESGMAVFNNNKCLSISDHDDFSLAANDFTIEAYLYPRTTSEYDGIISQRTSDDNNQSFEFALADGKLFFSCASSDGLTITDFVTATAIRANCWTHVAVERSGNNIYLFIDGITLYSAPFSDTIYNSTADITIGNLVGYNQYFDGYMDELRLSNGIARYPTSASFTPLSNDNPAPFIGWGNPL